MDVPWLSTDALQSVVESYLTAKELKKMFPWSAVRKETNRINDNLYNNYTFQEIIKLYRIAARSTFKAVDAVVASKIADGIDYILEGLHIEPQMVQKFVEKYGKENIKAVFLYKSDEKLFVENIQKSETFNDWIIERTQDKKAIYPKIAKMTCEYGKIFQKEARQSDFQVFNTDKNFEKQLKDIIFLLKNANPKI